MKNVEWGEYRIGELFEKLPVKKALKKDVRKYKNSEFNTPVVYCKFGDNGIMYWGRENEFTTYKNVISIVYNGAIAAGKVYAQKEKTGILAESYFIGLKDKKPTHNMNLFLSAILEKTLYYKYSREYLATWDGKVENDTILIPTKDGNIDFDFMESFIAELEAERIAELSAYLKVSGFDNYELSAQELKALENLKAISWGEYRIGKLFGKIKTKKLAYKAKELPNTPTGEFVLPCLTSSFQNQGLNYYVPKTGATILKNVITIPQNSDVYRAYYQSNDFTVLSDAYAMDWIYDDNKLTRNQYLFMVMCINKVTDLPIYSYKNKLGGWNVVKDKYILLPSTNGKIDLDFMNEFISAIIKLAIKDVVIYSDRKIKATKDVISKFGYPAWYNKTNTRNESGDLHEKAI